LKTKLTENLNAIMTGVMTQKSRILTIEDEKDVKDLMLLHLKREGYEAAGVEDGEEALKLLQSQSYDLVILDWMLPGLSGLEICKKIQRQFPILMVTARADTSDIVLGLEMGADDYITKPFEISVFLARVRAILRRAQISDDPREQDQIRIGNLVVNLKAHRVLCSSEEVQLTPSEFKLLTALVKNSGRVLSREKLIELVQGQGVVVIDRAIDTHIFGLRKKLGSCADIVETIRGVGYRIEAQ
jgi:two-component system phosphate regulon response regulator PhoB